MTQVVMRCSPSTKMTLDVWAPELASMTIDSMRIDSMRASFKDVKAKMGLEVCVCCSVCCSACCSVCCHVLTHTDTYICIHTCTCIHIWLANEYIARTHVNEPCHELEKDKKNIFVKYMHDFVKYT